MIAEPEVLAAFEQLGQEHIALDELPDDLVRPLSQFVKQVIFPSIMTTLTFLTSPNKLK